MTRALALTPRPDGTLVELGADDDALPVAVARDAATDVEGCPDGLLAEARACARRRTAPRLPWSCRAARDVGAVVVGELQLPACTRRMLYRHVASTPYLRAGGKVLFEFFGVPEPGEPAKPVFVGHRAVWAALCLPGWQTVEKGTLAKFGAAAADGDGPLALPFASLEARDWWATATAEATWPLGEREHAAARIAATPYLG